MFFTLYLLTAVFLAGCEIHGPDKDSKMLDWISDPYPAAIDSTYFLISDSLNNPTPEQRAVPVIIAAHGFSATTFEWQEFRDYADALSGSLPNDTSILVSQVLLGNHGLSYDDFRKGSWKDWQRPIMKEYRALADLGFTDISLAGASTGGTLILDLLHKKAFRDIQAPKHIFLIDPIVIPSSKLLSLANLIGPIYGHDVADNTDEEKPHWYSNRPYEALEELMDLLTTVRIQLEKGVRLPGNTRMKTYKAKKDGSAHPVGALLIFNGVEDSRGNYTQVQIVDSDKHVFTRGAGRKEWTAKDGRLQMRTFKEMRDLVLDK